MVLWKKFCIVFMGIVFSLSLAVTSINAQYGRHWRGDNGRHLGWYKHRGDRARFVNYSEGYRYYPQYRRVYYPGYVYSPRYVVYRSYPRYYGYDNYPYRYYHRRRGNRISVNLRF